MKLVYYTTKTKNTEKLVKKIDGYDIISIGSDTIISEPYILFTGTYARNDGTGAVHPVVIKFLNKNHNLIKGVVSTGNRNFGKYFAYAADIISQKCKVPIVHKAEFFGTTEDINIIKEKLKKIEDEEYQ
jgi:protein involved in ribonucleotide reduction